jgi:hypothetical protein
MSLFVMDSILSCIADGNAGKMCGGPRALAEASNQQTEGDP